MYTLEGTVLIQSSRNFIRMLMIIIFRSSLKLGHVGSKTRSLGQILEKPCVHSKRHSFHPKFMKLCQNVNHHNRLLIIIISRSSLKLGQVGSKIRLLDEIVEKPCVHSRGHSCNPKFVKLCQNVNHHNI